MGAKTAGKIPEGARILDAGAGERSYERYCGHLMYVAQDFAQYDGVGTVPDYNRECGIKRALIL